MSENVYIGVKLGGENPGLKSPVEVMAAIEAIETIESIDYAPSARLCDLLVQVAAGIDLNTLTATIETIKTVSGVEEASFLTQQQ